MLEFITKNHTMLIALLIVGITFAIISIILGLTMTISGTMIASFCLCFFGIIFILFSGYNLMYHPKTEEHLTTLKGHLNSPVPSIKSILSSRRPCCGPGSTVSTAP